MTTVVVGGGLAGLSVIEALRDAGVEDRIVLVSDEGRDPYSRPALSKQVLSGIWSAEQAGLRSAADLAALRIERVHGRATGLDRHRRELAIGSGRVAYDRLVIATGVGARRLPAALGSTSVLRTLDDLAALRAQLEAPRRVAVVGAGILGVELASALVALGHIVSVVGRSPRLTFGDLGDVISRRIAALLLSSGIDLRLGSPPIRRTDRSLLLADGGRVAADIVIGAIGCDPDTRWLRGSGLDLTDGVVCAAGGRAGDDIWAVGDVAAWPDATGRPRRVEHQQTAIEHAHAAARSMLGAGDPEPIEPFYWSEVCGTKILVHGRIGADAQLDRVAGEGAESEVLAARRGGRIEGLIGWNAPRPFRLARAELLRSRRPVLEMT